MTCKIAFVLFALISVLDINAQDTIYARRIIDTLTSRDYHGRGYTNDGLGKAMRFLEGQFDSIGLQPLNDNGFIQEFSYPVNTFPGDMMVRIDGKELRPGVDYIVAAESQSLKGKFELTKGDSSHFINQKAKLIVSLVKKLTWKVSNQEANYTTIYLLQSSIESDPQRIEVKIENKRIKNFKTGNVCGKLTGSQYLDSFIVFAAHYDHLGEMGKEAYFPGANDNASGVAMLLSLAKWFQTHRQPYSIVFILFSGEEAGLRGSDYFTTYPLIPLKSIRFLINLDLVGTGVDGITVVNSTEFDPEYQILQGINDRDTLLSAIYPRGKAKNSDHYWFTEKGVRAFFIYTLGGIQAYHDVFDVSETLPLNEFNDLHALLAEFVVRLAVAVEIKNKKN